MWRYAQQMRQQSVGGSNPRHHQNWIYFDFSKLAKRPLLARHANFLQSFKSSIPICKLWI
ncbi:MAG: hypothetical protein EBW73_02770 [Betaproteobacteria bacterium]|nr:hypothetical protein [Betaproteobacteria bacterium]NCV41497.1 hypothetical protein [Betaproteobacteria bacterium]NCV56296.1 hypothetical protein [Betaproteobacteria bacterium]NCW33420.1 hypothetical protein [Betaproteobacteria bacterium]NCX11747.1 hypothetical protein [Betaproteobacteria bacterium]